MVDSEATPKMAPTTIVVTPPPTESISPQDLTKRDDLKQAAIVESESLNNVGESAAAAAPQEPTPETKEKRPSRLRNTFRRIFNDVISFSTCCKGCRGSYETVPTPIRQPSLTEVQESADRDDASASLPSTSNAP